MTSSNKYIGRKHHDSRMIKISYGERNGNKSGKDFAFAVSILPTMPPTHFHNLCHGFNSVKALNNYCQANGIAIYKTGV